MPQGGGGAAFDDGIRRARERVRAAGWAVVHLEHRLRDAEARAAGLSRDRRRTLGDG